MVDPGGGCAMCNIGRVEVHTGGSAAVGFISKLVDMHATLGARIQPLKIPGNGERAIRRSLSKRDSSGDRRRALENSNGLQILALDEARNGEQASDKECRAEHGNFSESNIETRRSTTPEKRVILVQGPC